MKLDLAQQTKYRAECIKHVLSYLWFLMSVLLILRMCKGASLALKDMRQHGSCITLHGLVWPEGGVTGTYVRAHQALTPWCILQSFPVSKHLLLTS